LCSVTPQHAPIKVVERGTPWPSGRSKPIAQLNVDDLWVIAVTGAPLRSGDEAGLGPWVGTGGTLPSGKHVELLRYLAKPLYDLHTDWAADPRETLEEFLRVTGLARDAVHWHHPEA
jgi:hypothetical protein